MTRSEDDASVAAPATTTAPDDQAEDPPAQHRRRFRVARIPTLPLWQEAILVLVGAVVLALLLKTFVLQAFYIPSESMEPGLEKDDRILVQKVSYWFGDEPERGDVVVFEDPGGWLGAGADEEVRGVKKVLASVGLYPEGGHLVKRVIGVPGDVIVCCDKEGRIRVNGQPLDEDGYLAEGHRGDPVALRRSRPRQLQVAVRPGAGRRRLRDGRQPAAVRRTRAPTCAWRGRPSAPPTRSSTSTSSSAR